MDSTNKVRVFSYTSCGTRFLKSALENVGINTTTAPLGRSHASYKTVQNSTVPLVPGDTAIVIYADPRDSFVSLNKKQLMLHKWEEHLPLPPETPWRTVHRGAKGGLWVLVDECATAMEHLEIQNEVIEELRNNPFLESAPTAKLWRVWNKFKAFDDFFASWMASPDRPCPIIFIRYERLCEEATIRQLGERLNLAPQKSSHIYRDIVERWRPRSSTCRRLDLRRQHFLASHFKDLLASQNSLPPAYILERNNE
jgi:hypothetical protein|tara:strand:- start:4042 stop:4803 length:762 start_codon:yes stop_codon:yes gene_type:complete